MANDQFREATKKIRLIDANALETAIQGTASQVALDAPYDPEWFTRLAARQFEILKIIDDAPTVDAVEVVHGRWDEPSKHGLDKKYNKLGVMCSVCENWNDWPRRYCPNCGAKMDGGLNDE